MCYYKSVKTNARELAQQFKVAEPEFPLPTGDFNGFDLPKLAIITSKLHKEFSLAQWGLVPQWASADFEARNTLNAKIETLAEKPSFRDIVQQRCLIPITSFYEWKWLDTKGKNKQKFELGLGGAPFVLAGLWTEHNGLLSYTVVTQAANEFMAEIHNIKKRMPLFLQEMEYETWLNGEPVNIFEKEEFPLIAKQIAGQQTLF